MLGIPDIESNGMEVIARWSIKDDKFGNEKTFYTDSNGLEMQ